MVHWEWYVEIWLAGNGTLRFVHREWYIDIWEVVNATLIFGV